MCRLDCRAQARADSGQVGSLRKISVHANSERLNWLDATHVGANLDEACDRFEASWRAGERPRIEGFLADTTDSLRPALLRYLLAVELDYRGSLGELPELSEGASNI
jgi:hypothetical protein